MLFDNKLSMSSEFISLKPSLYPSITNIAEAMNTLIEKRHNHSESRITVKVYRGTQENKIYIANDGSGRAFDITDL